MSSEKLRLEAELKDNASAGVRKLKNEIAGVRRTPGMQALTGWFTDFSKGAEDFVSKGGGFAGTINAMGIGGLTAAASLAEMVKQMKDMGERALVMKELGREVGLTVDQVNAFTHAGAKFGVSGEAMGAALDTLAGQMPEFRRNLGPLMQELGRWPELIKKLQREGTSDQLKDIFEFLGKAEIQREPQLQKKLLGAFFGNGAEMEKLMAQGAKGVLDEIDKQSKSLGPITPEMLKQAQAFRDAQIGFNDALNRFETTVAPKFLNGMTAIINGAKAFFDLLGEDVKVDPRQRFRFGRDGLGHRSSFDGSGGLLHQASFGGTDDSLVESIAMGTKVGFLAAYRELTAGTDTSGGIGAAPAAFHPGERGGSGGGGGAPGLNPDWRRHGRSGGGGAERGVNTDSIVNRPGLEGFNTRGVRNMNIGNIGWGSWAKAHGAVGGAGSDTGHLVAVFPSFAAGSIAAKALALSKYNKGARSIDQLVAGEHGWTPGNHAAAANIAKSMGISPYADANLADKSMMRKFRDGLTIQELGPAGGHYALNHLGRRGFMGRGTASGGVAVNGAAPKWMDERSKRELSGINKELAANLLEASKRSGIRFAISQGLRTQAEADANARAGIGVRNSQHLYGAAADLNMIDPVTGQKTTDRAVYEKFAQSFNQINSERGTHQRWLGDSGGRWRSDIYHFDQGLGYGQTHKRDPFGSGGPTAADIKAGNEEAYRSPGNPFLGGRRASGLSGNGGLTVAAAGAAQPTHVKVEIHDHTGSKVKVKTTGHATHTLHRWPTNTQPSDNG